MHEVSFSWSCFLLLRIYHTTLHGTLFSCLRWCFQMLTWKVLDKLQKLVCRNVGLSLTASLEPLPWHRNVASLSLFCKYNFGRSLSKHPELVSFLILVGGPLDIRVGCMIFFAPILRCCKDTDVNSFFLRIDRLSNSLHVECFLLTNYLSGFKSRINGYLLSLCFFNIAIFIAFYLFSSCFSFNLMHFSGCSSLNKGESPLEKSYKNKF